MIKKILFTYFIILTFISCTRMTINSANNKAAHNDFYSGIEVLDTKIRKDFSNQELVKSYETIFNKGENYYTSTNNLRDLFLMEELYLDLPQDTKNSLSSISVDLKKHKATGQQVAQNILKEAKSITENTYRNKVKKYNLLRDISIFDKNLALNTKNDMERVLSKIEKTYKTDIKSNDYDLSQAIENYVHSGQGRLFKYATSNPDMKLEINVEVLSYIPANIDMQPFPKQYTETYKDNNGKELVNIVKYYENRYTNKTSMKVQFSYKLISNLTGEVIANGTKHFNKSYEEKWKTYYLLTNKVINANKIPRDEKEKEVPNKNKIITELTNNIFELINNDLAQLPAYK